MYSAIETNRPVAGYRFRPKNTTRSSERTLEESSSKTAIMTPGSAAQHVRHQKLARVRYRRECVLFDFYAMSPARRL